MRQVEEFFAQLSAESRYLRFMAPMPHLNADFLARLEHDLLAARAAVLVAVVDQDSQPCLIGGGRIVPTHRPSACEFSLTINYKMLAVALRRGFHLHCECGGSWLHARVQASS